MPLNWPLNIIKDLYIQWLLISQIWGFMGLSLVQQVMNSLFLLTKRIEFHKAIFDKDSYDGNVCNSNLI